uniref:Uncharacterized protein n=1 Tax=Avena sativa TaxID=4498 RepID=A0ACD5V1Y5_AVESA
MAASSRSLPRTHTSHNIERIKAHDHTWMASGTGKAMGSSWAAAMSVGAGTAEALKDRQAGLCRWNHAFRSVQHRASTTAPAGNSKTTKAAPSTGGAAARRKARHDQEEGLRTVMYLSNWGPNN